MLFDVRAKKKKKDVTLTSSDKSYYQDGQHGCNVGVKG